MTDSARTFVSGNHRTCIPLVRHVSEDSGETARIVRKHMRDLIIRPYANDGKGSDGGNDGNEVPGMGGERRNSARALSGRALRVAGNAMRRDFSI